MLPGGYLLEKRLSGEDAGLFETSRAADGGRALVKVVPESAVDADAQLEIWQRARSLRHTNLCQLLECGRAELAGQHILYAVFEYADDTLAAAIGRAPLTEAEAHEVLAAVADALRYLETQGLAHEALDPAHVLAVGDRITLSTDSLRESPAGVPYAGALREFWRRISPCTPERSAEILAEFLGAEPQAGPPPNPNVEVAERPVVAEAAPAVPPTLDAAPPSSKRFPRWIIVGAAAIVLLILGLNFRGSSDATPQPAATPAPPVAAPPVPQSPPAGTVSEPASTPVSEPASKAVAEPSSIPARAGQSMWRVIAYTYHSRNEALKKANQINRRHPDLLAEVFAPSQQKSRYLVSLGGRMSRRDALRIREKALAEGLPEDMYLQNYLE